MEIIQKFFYLGRIIQPLNSTNICDLKEIEGAKPN
jgi:hypothetical protein